MCGRHEPHLHHIDEDPSNNSPANLIPLCPNCHLQDIHDPTSPFDPEKVRLFRRLKDPFVLDPRFHPIWNRLKFLREGGDEQGFRWRGRCDDLLAFVHGFEMGDYYAERIRPILERPVHYFGEHLQGQGQDISAQAIYADPNLRKQANEFRTAVIEGMCVEMLRYQGWSRA